MLDPKAEGLLVDVATLQSLELADAHAVCSSTRSGKRQRGGTFAMIVSTSAADGGSTGRLGGGAGDAKLGAERLAVEQLGQAVGHELALGVDAQACRADIVHAPSFIHDDALRIYLPLVLRAITVIAR